MLQIKRSITITIVGLCALAGASGASAQAVNGRALTLIGGPAQYDLSGVGTTAFAALRLEVPVTSFLTLEPGLGGFSYETQFGSRAWYVMPEVQLQISPLHTRLRPYLGVGGGGAWLNASGENAFDPVLSAAGGLKFDLTPDWGLRGELRVRAIDPFTGSLAEWGLGVSRRF